MQTTTDPRAIRTKKLLVDAFNTLINLKDFNQITVKDVTDLATVNRATFYAHFVDKYALLDEVLTETMQSIMQEHFSSHTELTEQAVVQMFESIVALHDEMHTHCRRGYNTFGRMIEEKVKEQLAHVTKDLIHEADEKQRQMQATIFSWGLYGAYHDWDTTSTLPAAVYAKQAAKSLLKMMHV